MYVYSGNADLVFTFLILPVLFGAWARPELEPGVVLALRVLFGAVLGHSGFEAWRANRCAWHALAAFPAKYVLVVTLVACGLLAVGGAMALVNGQTKKNRAENIATTVASAVGFVVVWHWIKKLTRPSVAPRA